jgi:hypothetical protein
VCEGTVVDVERVPVAAVNEFSHRNKLQHRVAEVTLIRRPN